MTTFDPEATIERAAHIIAINSGPLGTHYLDHAQNAGRAALSTIAADVLAPIEAKHQPEETTYPGERARCLGCIEGCAYCEGDHYHDECPTAQAIADIKAKAGAR